MSIEILLMVPSKTFNCLQGDNCWCLARPSGAYRGIIGGAWEDLQVPTERSLARPSAAYREIIGGAQQDLLGDYREIIVGGQQDFKVSIEILLVVPSKTFSCLQGDNWWCPARPPGAYKEITGGVQQNPQVTTER